MKASSDVGLKTVSESDASTVTPNFARKSAKEERLTTLRTLLAKRREREATTTKTNGDETMHVQHGLQKTEIANDQSKDVATIQSPSSKSAELLAPFDLVGSDSMKLIDSSATLLHDRMKDPNATIAEACLCANQIANLLKLKLEIRKTRN